MKKKFGIKVFIILYCSLAASDAHAADKLELTLTEAINISLRENLNLKEIRLNTKIAEADIKFREGEFDPNIELKTAENYKKYPSASLLTGTEDRTMNADISLGGKINTGTTYELKWANERVRSDSGYLRTNPYYTSELILTMTQPILKGVGRDVQESNLNIAKNNLTISKLNVDDKVISNIFETAMAYWDLAFARYDLEVAELSLKLAQNLFNEAKAKIDAGLLAPVEIYKAEAEVSLREETLLKAKKIVLDAEDKLRAVMNLKDWKSELIPVGKIPQPVEAQPVEAAIDTAIKSRKDYNQALFEYKNKEILRKYFDNQRYPDFNIIGAAGLNGLNSSYGNTVDRLSSRDYYSWQFGISLRIPLGNRALEGNYLKAKHEEEKSSIALKVMEQKITVEVRETWRAVQLASETIKAAKKTRTAAEKRLEAEEGRFKVGMATLNDVLRFQEEYARALSSVKKAEIDYAKAAIGLEKVKGTLFHEI